MMAFGKEYYSVAQNARFGEVSEAQLATFKPGEDERRYLGVDMRKYLDEPGHLLEYLAGSQTLSWAITVGDGAAKDRQVAGLAVIHTDIAEPYTRTIVGSEFQRRGLSKVAHGIRMHHWFNESYADTLKCYVHPENEASIANVEKIGYYQVSTGADTGFAFDGYLTVNPYLWDEYHERYPNPKATPEVCKQVLATMSIQKTLRRVSGL